MSKLFPHAVYLIVILMLLIQPMNSSQCPDYCK